MEVVPFEVVAVEERHDFFVLEVSVELVHAFLEFFVEPSDVFGHVVDEDVPSAAGSDDPEHVGVLLEVFEYLFFEFGGDVGEAEECAVGAESELADFEDGEEVADDALVLHAVDPVADDLLGFVDGGG